ncbi:MAG TPA: type IV secretory system conjugative DNA transfer family protein, partial [Anaerolineales bacterium]|nr:type IV secretory system conjugative DNA transfer family protein [Anaerolineales bacterium]
MSAPQDQFATSIASEAVELLEDHLLFPGGHLLPLSARGGGVPGMSDRPWSRLSADVFFPNLPVMYSLALRREPPDVLRGSLRARRTLFEGFMMALAEKTGRRPSMAERSADHAMDAAESELTIGKPAFQIALMSALFVERDRFGEAEAARRVIESNLRARGLTAQRLFYITERALHHFQPGGLLFPGLDEPTLFLDEALPLLPAPSRQVLPVDDSVWIGTHARDGRDIHFSFTRGLDPAVPPPPHATTLILGEPGAGKTTLLRWIMLQRMLQGRTVISIDPEGENNRLCEAVGGKVVPAGIP